MNSIFILSNKELSIGANKRRHHMVAQVTFAKIVLVYFVGLWSMSVFAEDKNSLCPWLSTEASAYLSATGGPGMAVAVIDNGQLMCAQGFGVRQKNSDQVVAINTNFHVASVSKTFVAAAIAKLVSDGRVRLDDPVIKHVSSFRLADPRYRKITIRQLLNHTSGLPDVEDYGWDTPERDDQALARYVKSLSTTKLRSEPGSRFYYSNIGFEVLGAIVAHVSGRPFENFVQARLLAPSRMDRSSFIYVQGNPSDQATPHVMDASGNRVISKIYPFSRRHGPSSTLQSNVVDLGRWLGQMMGTPLESASPVFTRNERQLLLQPLARDISKDEPDRLPHGTHVALSWFQLPYKGRTLITHPGADDGFAALTIFDPQYKAGVVILTNADQAEPASVARPDGLPDTFGFELAAKVLDRLAAQRK
jgi:CubicO group peptidase (beta-lactamase class C family)